MTKSKRWDDYTKAEQAEMVAAAERISARKQAIKEAHRTGDKQKLAELGVKTIKVGLK